MENKIYNDSNPWLGLAPYQEGIPLYGRTKECVILSEIIKNNYVSVVFGKSGIGKTSLINAGISPLLRDGNYIPIKIRFTHNSNISYVEQIESKVKESIRCVDFLMPEIEALGLWDFFHRHAFYVEDNIECTPVIILDQFDEIYTLTEAEHKSDITFFFQELSSLLNDITPDVVIKKEKEFLQDSESLCNTIPIKIIKRTKASQFHYVKQANFRIVICLREDKLFLLERNCANIPTLKTNRVNLQELTTEGAMEVVMYPAKDLFTKENASNIVSNLSSVNDDGSPNVDPAILSLFLYKYYEKKGKASYDNVFSDYYKEATKDIRDKSLFFLESHLLTLNGYRNQIPMDDAISQGVSSDEINKLLDRIILRTEKRKGVDYIEFSHDRLCVEAKKNREERRTYLLSLKAKRKVFAIAFTLLISIIISCIFGWQYLKLTQYQKSLKEQKDTLLYQVYINNLQEQNLRTLNKRLKLQVVQNEHKTDSLNKLCILLLKERHLTSTQKKQIVKVTKERNTVLSQFASLKERIENNSIRVNLLKESIISPQKVISSPAIFNEEIIDGVYDEIEESEKHKKIIDIINY